MSTETSTPIASASAAASFGLFSEIRIYFGLLRRLLINPRPYLSAVLLVGELSGLGGGLALVVDEAVPSYGPTVPRRGAGLAGRALVAEPDAVPDPKAPGELEQGCTKKTQKSAKEVMQQLIKIKIWRDV